MLGAILVGILIAAILIFTYYGLFPKQDNCKYEYFDDEE